MTRSKMRWALLVAAACGSDDSSAAPDAQAGDDASTVDVAADSSQVCAGDVLAPFEGGAAYYAKWKNGPPSSPTFFPISVWLQTPSNAPKFAAIGINQYIGLYNGPVDADLTTLKASGMPVLCDQNAVGLAHLSDATIRGWTQQDEPDNAQPNGEGGYGPCVDPSVITTNYAAWTTNDPSRPVFLSFGQGASDIAYIGRGSACASKTSMYPQYIAGADVVSFDIYPVNNAAGKTPPLLWMVAQGVDNLRGWAANAKPVWVWIETTAINGAAKPTVAQLQMEVWSAIVHGALGIGYFVHQFAPTFVEAALLADAVMSKAVNDTDAQIASLAPALNTPSIRNGVTVTLTDKTTPVDVMVKRQGGYTYLFAVGMRDGTNTATFDVTCVSAATKVEVVGESRTLDISSGSFTDGFDPFAVHIYRIAS